MSPVPFVAFPNHEALWLITVSNALQDETLSNATGCLSVYVHLNASPQVDKGELGSPVGLQKWMGRALHRDGGGGG